MFPIMVAALVVAVAVVSGMTVLVIRRARDIVQLPGADEDISGDDLLPAAVR
jgi:uncharacterized protein with PhoU and TrkA domain